MPAVRGQRRQARDTRCRHRRHRLLNADCHARRDEGVGRARVRRHRGEPGRAAAAVRGGCGRPRYLGPDRGPGGCRSRPSRCWPTSSPTSSASLGLSWAPAAALPRHPPLVARSGLAVVGARASGERRGGAHRPGRAALLPGDPTARCSPPSCRSSRSYAIMSCLREPDLRQSALRARQPGFDRWHHTSEDEGLDTNFAGLFPFIDLALSSTFHTPA